MEEGACHKDYECKERRGEVWVFDNFTPEQGDFVFLEDAAQYQVLPKCLNKGHFTDNHKCGIGKMVDGYWRHLDKVSILRTKLALAMNERLTPYRADSLS